MENDRRLVVKPNNEECMKCKNNMLCVTSGHPLYVPFGENSVCFHFESGSMSRPLELYKYLKGRYADQERIELGEKMNRKMERLSSVGMKEPRSEDDMLDAMAYSHMKKPAPFKKIPVVHDEM
jgi:hypothetical protein